MSRLILLAALAVVAAGCASATAGGPGALDGAASYLPGDTVTFVAATTDRWPDGVVAQPAWLTDLRPALGDEVDVAALPGEEVVALTRPNDDAKLAALTRKHDLATRHVGDWTAIARTSDDLRDVHPQALSLAENNRFRTAMERIPSDALVRAYANGDEAQNLAGALPGQLTTSNAPLGMHYRFGKPCVERQSAATLGCVEFRWAAAALTETRGGLKLDGVLKTGELISPGPPRYVVAPTPAYAPGLPDEIPADALAVVDFPVPSGTFQLLPELPPLLERLVGPARYDLGTQLDALLHGESAIYVRSSLPMPELTLVTQPLDTRDAIAALDDLVAHAPPTSPLHGVELHHAVIGGQLVVSTTQAGIEVFRGAGAKLSADPSFLKAKELSGMPEETTGFVYANLKDVLPLLRLAGVKLPRVGDVRTVLAYGAQGVNERTFTGFLQVGSS
jgi:hypothetical protein